MITCYSVQHASDKEWTHSMKKGCTFNASNKCFNDHIHQTKNKWRILPIVRQWTLEDETYIISEALKIRTTICAKIFIIISIKSIMDILVKLEKTLKTPWTYWEKKLSVGCKSIFKTDIDLVIEETQSTNLFCFV